MPIKPKWVIGAGGKNTFRRVLRNHNKVLQQFASSERLIAVKIINPDDNVAHYEAGIALRTEDGDEFICAIIPYIQLLNILETGPSAYKCIQEYLDTIKTTNLSESHAQAYIGFEWNTWW